MPEEENINITKEVQDVESPPAEPAPEEAAEKEKKSLGLIAALFFYVLPFIANALITCGLIWGYDQYVAQKIVAVDIKGFISQQRELYVAGKIDSEQFQRNVDRMEALVTDTKPNQVVLMGDAVVRNAKIIDVYPKTSQPEHRQPQ